MIPFNRDIEDAQTEIERLRAIGWRVFAFANRSSERWVLGVRCEK